jgi:hypothetical protein
MKPVGASRKHAVTKLQSHCSAIVGQAPPACLGNLGRQAGMPVLQIDTRSGDFSTADLDKRRFGDRRSLFFVRNPSRQIDRRGGLGLLLRSRT